MKFTIIGLGNFGFALAEKLTQQGHEVIGVDKNINKIEENESPRRKRTGYHDGLFILFFASRGGEFNPKRLKIKSLTLYV